MSVIDLSSDEEMVECIVLDSDEEEEDLGPEAPHQVFIADRVTESGDEKPFDFRNKTLILCSNEEKYTKKDLTSEEVECIEFNEPVTDCCADPFQDNNVESDHLASSLNQTELRVLAQQLAKAIETSDVTNNAFENVYNDSPTTAMTDAEEAVAVVLKDTCDQRGNRNKQSKRSQHKTKEKLETSRSTYEESQLKQYRIKNKALRKKNRKSKEKNEITTKTRRKSNLENEQAAVNQADDRVVETYKSTERFSKKRDQYSDTDDDTNWDCLKSKNRKRRSIKSYKKRSQHKKGQTLKISSNENEELRDNETLSSNLDDERSRKKGIHLTEEDITDPYDIRLNLCKISKTSKDSKIHSIQTGLQKEPTKKRDFCGQFSDGEIDSLFEGQCAEYENRVELKKRRVEEPTKNEGLRMKFVRDKQSENVSVSFVKSIQSEDKSEKLDGKTCTSEVKDSDSKSETHSEVPKKSQTIQEDINREGSKSPILQKLRRKIIVNLFEVVFVDEILIECNEMGNILFCYILQEKETSQDDQEFNDKIQSHQKVLQLLKTEFVKRFSKVYEQINHELAVGKQKKSLLLGWFALMIVNMMNKQKYIDSYFLHETKISVLKLLSENVVKWPLLKVFLKEEVEFEKDFSLVLEIVWEFFVCLPDSSQSKDCCIETGFDSSLEETALKTAIETAQSESEFTSSHIIQERAEEESSKEFFGPKDVSVSASNSTGKIPQPKVLFKPNSQTNEPVQPNVISFGKEESSKGFSGPKEVLVYRSGSCAQIPLPEALLKPNCQTNEQVQPHPIRFGKGESSKEFSGPKKVSVYPSGSCGQISQPEVLLKPNSQTYGPVQPHQISFGKEESLKEFSVPKEVSVYPSGSCGQIPQPEALLNPKSQTYELVQPHPISFGKEKSSKEFSGPKEVSVYPSGSCGQISQPEALLKPNCQTNEPVQPYLISFGRDESSKDFCRSKGVSVAPPNSTGQIPQTETLLDPNIQTNEPGQTDIVRLPVSVGFNSTSRRSQSADVHNESPDFSSPHHIESESSTLTTNNRGVNSNSLELTQERVQSKWSHTRTKPPPFASVAPNRRTVRHQEHYPTTQSYKYPENECPIRIVQNPFYRPGCSSHDTGFAEVKLQSQSFREDLQPRLHPELQSHSQIYYNPLSQQYSEKYQRFMGYYQAAASEDYKKSSHRAPPPNPFFENSSHYKHVHNGPVPEPTRETHPSAITANNHNSTPLRFHK